LSDYDLIIFDCDGTLVDSEAICNAVLVDLVNQYADKQYTLDYALCYWAGMTLSNVLAVVQEEQGCDFPDDVRDRYVETCNQKYQIDLKPVSGAIDLVESCNQSVEICVGSNGERTNVFDSLKLCGFSPNYFTEDNIFTRIQVPNGKPEPDLFLFAAEKMAVDPKRCLVIEDSESGVTAGKEAGMEVWGFTGVSHDPIVQEKTLLAAGALSVFERLIHIQQRLGH